MSKTPLIAIAIVAVAGIAMIAVTFESSNTSSKTVASASKSVKTSFTERKACDILSAAIAQQLIGSDATSSDTSAGNNATSSVSVTNCAYYSPSTKATVSLLSRSALDSSGAATNQSQFNATGLPADAQKVSGYGDSAYWSSTYGQLNILKHNNWYILETGGLKPTDRSLSQTQQYADLIVNKL